MKIRLWKSKNYRTGANIYNNLVYDVLKENKSIRTINPLPYSGRGVTYLNFLITFLRSLFADKQAIHIIDYGAACWVSQFMPGKKILIFHHFDPEESKKRAKQKFLLERFLKLTKSSDKVVVVAKYWKNFLVEEGIAKEKIEVIYNAFDITKYSDPISKEQFYKKFGLDNKPIIYIGKNSVNKTRPTYDILKKLDADFHIVTSGASKEFTGPVYLDLGFRDYISLLHHAKASILFTPFNEGWNRIAHESLLCGTPVIGSSYGGLGELLSLAGQPKVNNIEGVIEQIPDILDRQVQASQIKKFNLDYFSKKWNDLINEIRGKC